MTATLIMEIVCVAGVLFMLRFLIALFADGKRKCGHHVVSRISWAPQRREGVLLYRAESEAPGTQPRQRAGFRVIEGGSNPPARKIG